MKHFIKTKKGLDIALQGQAEETVCNVMPSAEIALIPDHFNGIIPKMTVKEGEQVKAGTVIFYDKNVPMVKFTAPVSGILSCIERGERRKILSVRITPSAKIEYEKFPVLDINKASADEIKELLSNAGMLPFIKQRPFDVIADPARTPKNIFVSAWDTAPLAANCEFILKGQGADFQKGIDVLTRLTDGKVFVGIKHNSNSVELRMLKNAEIIELDGPHPIGNVGVQINHIAPVNKGDTVWTLNVQAVLYIGRLFNKGVADFSKIIALTGTEVVSPRYYKTVVGTTIASFVKGNVYKELPLRYISGNVLTGTQIEQDGWLNAYDSQITVIREGSDVHELVGWAMPRFSKFSVSRTYFSWLLDNKLMKWINKYVPLFDLKYKYDTRILGGERAFIMSGEYDKVLPMDILPEFLVKAMITEDIDKMEQLGIYEIAPEDLALCEFVCTSKIEVQKITRQALDLVKKEV